MAHGYLLLVLHAHLPFVRHPEHDIALEEDWLFEAITETYLPLLSVFEGLERDGVGFRLTMSISPTLVEMFNDPLLQERYLRSLDRLIELTGKEIERTRWLGPFHDLARMYHDWFSTARQLYSGKYNRNLTAAFGRLHDAGFLELITCAATHAYLPLLAVNETAVRSQISIACAHFEAAFGRRPKGIWLPECGYHPGLERPLEKDGLSYFFTDAHGVMFAQPRPRHGALAPVVTSNGVSVFGRDLESSEQVWSSKSGYPGDPSYRDFYRDIGFELDFDYIRPYIQPNGHRKMTGVKYYRVTGGAGEKDVYDRRAASDKAAQHADDFIRRRIAQAERAGGVMDRPPLMVAPYDAELFGHWWFEGPQFLDALIRKLHHGPEAIELVTASDYLGRHPDNQVVAPAASSWGLRGYSEMWLDESNDWVYRHIHKASERMVTLAARHPKAEGVMKRALNQAARELLLAQSSDWVFMMKSGAMTGYASRRIHDHLTRFTRLYEQVRNGTIDERFLRDVEAKDTIFASFDYRVYIPGRE